GSCRARTAPAGAGRATRCALRGGCGRTGSRSACARRLRATSSRDRTFHRSRDFFRGFYSARTGYLLYNYGLLDGGVGGIWSLRQVFFVAGGMRDATVLMAELRRHPATIVRRLRSLTI